MLQKIFILTPCMNAVDTIDRTIMSVVTQAGDFKIRYHIQDAGSTDGTFERVLWWKNRLESPDFPLQCKGIEFSAVSEPDEGLYDGLIKGFKHMSIRSDDFMAWINADDVLMIGALSLISQVRNQFSQEQASWVGGGCAIVKNNHITTNNDRKVPTEAIRLGLCDGMHWDFIQQEGTFFRKWLWDSIDPEVSIGQMRLAGDWNLWRLFAQQAYLVQFTAALGGFRRRDGQLSATQRDRYMGEIASLVGLEERKQSLSMLSERGNLIRRKLTAHWQTGVLAIAEEVVNDQLAVWYQRVFGQSISIPSTVPSERKLYKGQITPSSKFRDTAGPTERFKNIYAYDSEWQYPAITEQHAFHQIRDAGGAPSGMAYIAYPWATLIDKIQAKAKEADSYLHTFRQFCYGLDKALPKVTVCQHIMMRDYLHLFEEAGIEDIFWAHATTEDVAAQATSKIRIHPFPLYPVQVTEALPQDEAPRPYLFSFIGAKSNQWYLTDVRAWIIDALGGDPRGQVIGRESWHYNKIVYDHQILTHRKRSDDSLPLIDHSASEEFKKSLTESIFSLCPSGSGPNSIRLWESIGAGSIPVILSDHYAPPGDRKLWEAAVVFCEETLETVKALPDRLAAIAADAEQLERMRHAMRQLWLLYGPQSFVYDIQKLASERSSALDEVVVEDLSVTAQLASSITKRGNLSKADAALLLRTCANDLLMDVTALKRMVPDTLLGNAIQKAQAVLGPDNEVAQHFKKVWTYRLRSEQLPVAPSINRGAVPAIYLMGRHSNRTPLSYTPFRRTLGDRLRFVDDVTQSDLIVSGFNIDVRENAPEISRAKKMNPNIKTLIISEEPLWDTVWSNGFTDRNRVYKDNDQEISYRFLNHHTSSIFSFNRIPYFLLTNDNFSIRYASLLYKQAQQTPDELLNRWRAAPVNSAFFAEVREQTNYAKKFPEFDVYGLSVFRTEVARKYNTGKVLRVGAGWSPQVSRQELPDWHLDKLAHLEGRVRVISAYENTHQRDYISEKIFDAFAAGGVPTYYASERHRLFDLIPKEAIINSFGMSSDEAVGKITEFEPDEVFAEAWLQAVSSLAQLFHKQAIAISERQRLVGEVLREINAYL